MTSTFTRGEYYDSYCAYFDPKHGKEHIGHLDDATQSIQPLAFKSGTYLSSLLEVIHVGEQGIIPAGDALPRSSVQLLPPLSNRDILCVGKNYSEHAKEFNQSGFDSSDKVDQPTHPVIFTKRFTSVIADGDEILPHTDFTKTLDYEGELGVIIGKPGFRISEEDAMSHVWGYTIINDLTARERQRDHKQFYIGKSADTFCPMGPVAVPAHGLGKTFRVQTHVNGELRQDATTEDLIFSIPHLVKTLSEGQTLMPGDILATGTPAGVGIGRDPPTYLQPGDEISVSITGLGRLTNRIAPANTENPTLARFERNSTLTTAIRPNQYGLTTIGNKVLNIKKSGLEKGHAAIFIHGLGGTAEYWTPLLDSSNLKDIHSCYALDLEGHGLSPTNPLSQLSIASFAADVKVMCSHFRITTNLTLFAHSFGCLVALRFALDNPGLVTRLVLMGPPPNPLPEVWKEDLRAKAALVRREGMSAIIDTVSAQVISEQTKWTNPLASSAVRLSLSGQNAEGYAKACTAFAEADEVLQLEDVHVRTMLIAGSQDVLHGSTSSEDCAWYWHKMMHVMSTKVLEGVGHWHVFEDPQGVAKALKDMPVIA